MKKPQINVFLNLTIDWCTAVCWPANIYQTQSQSELEGCDADVLEAE